MAKGIDAAEEADRFKVWLSAGAVIEDPMALPGLLPRVRQDAVPIEGVPFDTQLTTKEKADCALCGRARNHFKGFVVTFQDQTRAIIGRDCGEEKLFAQGAWKDMAASAERRKRRALFDVRAAPTIAAIDALLPLFELCQRAVNPLEAFLSEVAADLPDLYAGLTAAEKRGGTLSRAVDKKIQAINRQGETYWDFIQELRQFGTVPSFVPLHGGGLGGQLKAIRKALEAVKAQLSVEDISLEQQSAAFVKLNQLGTDFRQLHTEADKAQTFLSPSFWEAVCKWGNADSYREGNYRVAGKRKVRHSDADYLYGEATLPTSLTYELTAFETVRQRWPRL